MEHLVTLDTDQVSLYRFRPPMLPSSTGPLPAGSLRGIYLDTETTGLEETDKCIEIALVPFDFHVDHGLLHVLPSVHYLQDPGFPIPEEASDTNHITDEMVAGKQADWARIAGLLQAADIILCHNTKFDRPVVHRSLKEYGQPAPTKAPWGCSMAQLSWKTIIPGVPSIALGALAAWSGFFFSAHRADADCQAALYLLHHHNLLGTLYKAAVQPRYVVKAKNIAFQQNAQLKPRGYRFDYPNKVWYFESLSKEEAQAEKQWLTEHIYKGTFKGECVIVPATENFI